MPCLHHGLLRVYKLIYRDFKKGYFVHASHIDTPSAIENLGYPSRSVKMVWYYNKKMA